MWCFSGRFCWRLVRGVSFIFLGISTGFVRILVISI